MLTENELTELEQLATQKEKLSPAGLICCLMLNPYRKAPMSYPEFVRSRFKSGEKIAEEMTLHKLLWIAVQSSNVCWATDRLDEVKKYAIYNKTNSEVAAWSRSGIDGYKDINPTPQQAELLHAAIGIAGEAGELLDAIRKHIFEGQPLDRENVIEELGDLCFYLEAAMQVIGHDREWIQAGNMIKLQLRYKAGYSDKAAQERADKAGAE